MPTQRTNTIPLLGNAFTRCFFAACESQDIR
jgi:hypothetical protein